MTDNQNAILTMALLVAGFATAITLLNWVLFGISPITLWGL